MVSDMDTMKISNGQTLARLKKKDVGAALSKLIYKLKDDKFMASLSYLPIPNIIVISVI